jgi:hypothetical protein
MHFKDFLKKYTCYQLKEFDHFDAKFAKVIQLFMSKRSDPWIIRIPDKAQLFRIRPDQKVADPTGS